MCSRICYCRLCFQSTSGKCLLSIFSSVYFLAMLRKVTFVSWVCILEECQNTPSVCY